MKTPENLVSTRLALHRLAAYVIAPSRHVHTGRFGLRAAHRGFGTPVFHYPDRQIRIHGNNLVERVGEKERQVPITSLSDAAEWLGCNVDPETAAEHDSPPVGDLQETLIVDEEASLFLGDWFEMAFHALHDVRADEASVDASEPQLWPGHFDPAIEIGDAEHRASYGASPGDDSSDEPYLYTSVWSPDLAGVDPDDPLWNATAFTGAILPWSAFPEGEEPVEVAKRFWRTTRDALLSE